MKKVFDNGLKRANASVAVFVPYLTKKKITAIGIAVPIALAAAMYRFELTTDLKNVGIVGLLAAIAVVLLLAKCSPRLAATAAHVITIFPEIPGDASFDHIIAVRMNALKKYLGRLREANDEQKN